MDTRVSILKKRDADETISIVNDTIETVVIDRSLDLSFVKDMSPIGFERKFIHIENRETMIKPVTL